MHSKTGCSRSITQRPTQIAIFDSAKLRTAEKGQSLVQLLAVVAIAMILAALALPNINRTTAAERLRSSAGDLSSLIQQTRIRAARDNAAYPVLFGTSNGAPIAWSDLNPTNGVWDIATEPVVYFYRVFPAAGPPPAPYVLVGDSGAGPFPAGTTVGFSPRGLPCAYVAGPPVTCTTPAAQYFTFYLTNNQPSPGWAVVVVTKGGRSKVSLWNGSAWGN